MPESRRKIRATAVELNSYLRQSGVSAEDRHKVVMDAIDALVLQENEATGRTLGDHGINHIRGDIAMALNILAEHPAADMPQQAAQVYLAGIYHDIGYVTKPAQMFLNMGHPRWSAQHYDANVRPSVAKALGQSAASEIGHMVRTHAATNIDWKDDVTGSAFRTADNLALFQREKLPALFRVPGNVDVLKRWGAGKLSLEGARKALNANIDRAGYSSEIARRLKRSSAETFSLTPKYTLGMLGGETERVRWKSGHLHVYLKMKPEVTELNKLGDFGQRQFAKLAKTYGVPPEHFTRSLRFQFKSPRGEVLLESHIVK